MPSFAKFIPCILLAAWPLSSLAKSRPVDSLTPVPGMFAMVNIDLLAPDASPAWTDSPSSPSGLSNELHNIEVDIASEKDNRTSLLRLLRVMRVKKILHYRKSRKRLYTDLAGLSARLRLYPLAMECYYNASAPADSVADDGTIISGDDAVFSPADAIDTNTNLLQAQWVKESPPVKTSSLLQSFNDGKDVLACAILIHVKQPRPGKRKTFTGINNVGHTFVTLIKYNTDRTSVSRSFGFYPVKDGLLSATPLRPSASSTFKDDALHDWDEIAGKFISYRRFQKILRLLSKYENKKYNLNGNNCTDFGLAVAAISGIAIEDTRWTWFLGEGNNPGHMGQSMLNDKLLNTDTGNREGLFRVSGSTIIQK